MGKFGKITFVFVFIVFISIALFYRMDYNEPGRNAAAFLKHMVNKEYDEAFQYVEYYSVSDLEPEMSYDDAKAIWIGRVKRQEQQGFFIESYEHLRTGYDDSYPRGRVLITVNMNGDVRKMECDIYFGRLSGTWKVGKFTILDEIAAEPAHEFLQDISGHIEGWPVN